MSDEKKKRRPADSDAGSPDHGLAAAFEELLAAAATRREAQAAVPGGVSLPDAGPCPERGEWLRLVCGETSGAESDALLAHAAECSPCAALMRQSLHTLSEDELPGEAEELRALASTSPQWQHRLAVELAHTPRKRFAGVLLWAGSGLAAALVLAAGLLFWWQHQNTPEILLAEAYTHSRIFDLRVPGASYSQVQPKDHLRGGTLDREPSQLLEARARIVNKLEQNPNSAHWLQMEARADLLEEKFDTAIDILDRLLASGPVTPSLLVDGASAYFQRGTATGSQNDRATALDYLRRADELAPDDPVVLFNEAVVMEDCGQVMNAVETWTRYLDFERDPHWLNEGRSRLNALKEKLNRLKSHQSRMEQHLATPQAMRVLAADPSTLDSVDEELSTTLLPRLLRSAFPLPVDRSRGSPCAEACTAARMLLRSLAASLERNHQDPWLSRLLPSQSSPPDQHYVEAAHALEKAIDADNLGDYLAGRQWAVRSSSLFHGLKNAAGEDRAELERAYALQRLARMDECYTVARALLNRDPQFAWIHADGLLEYGICDTGPGTASDEIPAYGRAAQITEEHHFALLGMRARNQEGGIAIESDDTEDAWRVYLQTIRQFYTGDYPPFRAYTIMSGLAEVEKSTPRVHLELLLQREVMGILELTGSRDLYPSQRFDLAIAAIRAGSIPEAQEALRRAQSELAANGGDKANQSYLADSEIAMAGLYMARGDLHQAAATLDSAHRHMAGIDDFVIQRAYAAARGQLELALGHPEIAEPALRYAILDEELQARRVGAANILFAQQDRDLYAVLAGIWQVQGRPGEDILAMWERYRLRILGKAVPACPDRELTCLKPQLMSALARMGNDRLMGQVVLLDRTLLYEATSHGVVWNSTPVGREYVLAAAERLERAVSSPVTSKNSVDAAALRVGNLFLRGLPEAASGHDQLSLEPDPLLGNLPWAAAETAGGPIGLRLSIEEQPSLLLGQERSDSLPGRPAPAGAGPLVVGASFAAGKTVLLPEVLNEARIVARFAPHSNLLLGSQATETRVVARLETAPVIHFAGHTTEEDGTTRLLLAPSHAGSTGPAAGPPYLDSDVLRKYPPRAARLAVFSACSTGKREEGWNHGMGDIVNTLASLGVPQVVATRWQIDSSSAVPLMDAFYGGLARGLSVPQALTAARQSLSRDARYSHPYYWAAYYASGWGKGNMREVFDDKSK